ncbi:MAG: flagellin N-terminal helical domain-containing protein [Planctomycetota bacterium]|jgi:flagellin
MGLRLNTNLASLQAHHSLGERTRLLQDSFRRLSSGLRIAQAADDAAGLAISERFRARISGNQRALQNAFDGISLAQTSEGALQEVSNMLTRLRELSVHAANLSVGSGDRDTLQEEFAQLVAEIDRIARATTFAGVNILDGSATTLTFQVGAGAVPMLDTIAVSLTNLLNLNLGSLDIGSGGDTSTALSALDTAIDTVSSMRGLFGAAQNRLTSTIQNLRIQGENLAATESRIRDVDLAVETAELTKHTLMQQAAVSVLAQANVQQQVALTLLR